MSIGDHLLYPDAHFTVEGQLHPGIVTEVAISQPPEYFSEKASNYFAGNSGVRLVIGLNARHGRRLDLYLWVSPTECSKIEILNGDHTSSGTLNIPLGAFGSPSLAIKFPGADLDQKFVLKSDEIATVYDSAFKDHASRQLLAGGKSPGDKLDLRGLWVFS